MKIRDLLMVEGYDDDPNTMPIPGFQEKIPAPYWRADAANKDYITAYQSLDPHTIDEAREYMKYYPYRKTYTVIRAQPGFRGIAGRIKTADYRDAIDYAVKRLKLTMTVEMCGSRTFKRSVGYSWFVLETAERTTGILYYQDRGMATDSITICGSSPEQLARSVGMFRATGSIPDPEKQKLATAARREENIELALQKGIGIGDRVSSGRREFEVVGVAKNGKLKLKELTGPGETPYFPDGKWTASPRVLKKLA